MNHSSVFRYGSDLVICEEVDAWTPKSTGSKLCIKWKKVYIHKYIYTCICTYIVNYTEMIPIYTVFSFSPLFMASTASNHAALSLSSVCTWPRPWENHMFWWCLSVESGTSSLFVLFSSFMTNVFERTCQTLQEKSYLRGGWFKTHQINRVPGPKIHPFPAIARASSYFVVPNTGFLNPLPLTYRPITSEPSTKTLFSSESIHHVWANNPISPHV